MRQLLRVRCTKNVFRYRSVFVALLALIPGLWAQSASSEQYPERNITLVVPFAAGGASDVSARIMAEAMSKYLGQTIVVENVAGAGGATGTLRVKTAKPDGYTIGQGHIGTLASSVAVNPKLPYDPRKDFAQLGIVNVTPNIIITRKDFPANTLQEFIAYAREKGKDLKMAHNGVGSASHLTCILFFQLINAQPTYVVYRGYGQTINDIMSGAVDGTCELVASAAGHIRGGAVKGFGVAADQRAPSVPNVPTSTEGGLPEFKMESWIGLMAPKGVPPAILAKLREAVSKSLAEPEVQKKFADIGGLVPPLDRQGAEVMQKVIESDVARWTEVVNKAGPDAKMKD
jgi:tripartite-type tricarboxylate transporter receptor subunit TctC